MFPLLGSLYAFLALSAGVVAHPKGHGSTHAGKAVYFITNDETNAIGAVPVRHDGTLSKGTVTPTGGKGSVIISGTTNLPAQGDGLVSQSAITRSGDYLFAVNPGSNTLSMFKISKHDPTDLTPVGKPAAIPGEFPNTVAALPNGNVVCVATTGAVAGVSCANFGKHGIGPLDDLRQFDLGQSTPPVGPPNTVSQVLFSEDGDWLYTLVKNNPNTNATGFVSAFPVERKWHGAKVSQIGVRSSPESTSTLFGSETIPGTSNIFMTDTSIGGVILSVNDEGYASTAALGPIDGQMATCWVTISPATKTAFVTDVLVPRLVELTLDDAKIVSELDLTSTGAPGLIDLGAAGNFVYALAPGDGTTSANLVVVDVGHGEPKLKQTFDLVDLGAGVNSQGVAILS